MDFMANEEQVALLKQGRDIWNKWRQEHPEEKLDFYYADLNGANLRAVDLKNTYLTNAKMMGADLSGAQLQGADLTGVDLEGAKLIEADLSGVEFQGALMSGADLSSSNIEKASFLGSEIKGANFSGANGATASQLEEAIRDEATLLPEFLPEVLENEDLEEKTGFLSWVLSIFKK